MDPKQLIGNVAAQGKRFDGQIAEDGRYYGFLCKADFNEAEKKWDVFFEVVNRKFLDNVLNRTTLIPAKLPRMPGLGFHLKEVEEEVLLKTLGLTDVENLAEGSWYELELDEGSGGAQGVLYDPDLIELGTKPPGGP